MRASLLLAALVLLPACATEQEQAPTVVATPTCDPDVAVVAARGSTEALGLAGPAGTVTTALADGLARRTVTVAEVDYPATLDRYESSVTEGASATEALARDALAACGDTRLVLVGYSQGAQVIGDLLATAGDEVLSRVAAVVLVADPTRAAADPSAELYRGPASGGEGGDGLLGGRTVPAELAGRVLHWCNPADAICDSDACTRGVLACLLGGPGLAAHTDYSAPDVGPVVSFVRAAAGAGAGAGA